VTSRKSLKEFRKGKKLTQKQLADFMKYSRSQYALIELGQRNGSSEFWTKFQETFNIDDNDMWKLTKKE
jgi:transcriptional regulator with XRE-family HTH domain